MPWSYPVDVFAAGCVIAEFVLGQRLFAPAGSSTEYLAMLDRILGPFPPAFVVRVQDDIRGKFVFGHVPKVQFSAEQGASSAAVRSVQGMLPLGVRVSFFVVGDV